MEYPLDFLSTDVEFGPKFFQYFPRILSSMVSLGNNSPVVTAHDLFGTALGELHAKLFPEQPEHKAVPKSKIYPVVTGQRQFSLDSFLLANPRLHSFAEHFYRPWPVQEISSKEEGYPVWAMPDGINGYRTHQIVGALIPLPIMFDDRVALDHLEQFIANDPSLLKTFRGAFRGIAEGVLALRGDSLQEALERTQAVAKNVDLQSKGVESEDTTVDDKYGIVERYVKTPYTSVEIRYLQWYSQAQKMAL